MSASSVHGEVGRRSVSLQCLWRIPLLLPPPSFLACSSSSLPCPPPSAPPPLKLRWKRGSRETDLFVSCYFLFCVVRQWGWTLPGQDKLSQARSTWLYSLLLAFGICLPVGEKNKNKNYVWIGDEEAVSQLPLRPSWSPSNPPTLPAPPPRPLAPVAPRSPHTNSEAHVHVSRKRAALPL